METLSKKDNTYFHRNGTFIKLSNNNLLILDSNTLDRATFAIKVCNNFYIELGRPLQDFKSVLMEADIPIVFEKITSVYGYTHYNIIRMATDDVADIILGTLICKDGIIEKITCDSRYKSRDDFNEHDSIGRLWSGGSFPYSNIGTENKENAKHITLVLMSLDVMTDYDTPKEDFLFSPFGSGSTIDLDIIRSKIRRDNIEAEFESGDIESAYLLVEEEFEELTEIEENDEFEEAVESFDMSDFETEDDVELAFLDPDEYTANIDRFLDAQMINKVDQLTDGYTEVTTVGNITVDTTYSTVKIEVTLQEAEKDNKYKFTFILNEISRMYELISITLV